MEDSHDIQAGHQQGDGYYYNPATNSYEYGQPPKKKKKPNPPPQDDGGWMDFGYGQMTSGPSSLPAPSTTKPFDLTQLPGRAVGRIRQLLAPPKDSHLFPANSNPWGVTAAALTNPISPASIQWFNMFGSTEDEVFRQLNSGDGVPWENQSNMALVPSTGQALIPTGAGALVPTEAGALVPSGGGTMQAVDDLVHAIMEFQPGTTTLVPNPTNHPETQARYVVKSDPQQQYAYDRPHKPFVRKVAFDKCGCPTELKVYQVYHTCSLSTTFEIDNLVHGIIEGSGYNERQGRHIHVEAIEAVCTFGIGTSSSSECLISRVGVGVAGTQLSREAIA